MDYETSEWQNGLFVYTHIYTYTTRLYTCTIACIHTMYCLCCIVCIHTILYVYTQSHFFGSFVCIHTSLHVYTHRVSGPMSVYTPHLVVCVHTPMSVYKRVCIHAPMSVYIPHLGVRIHTPMPVYTPHLVVALYTRTHVCIHNISYHHNTHTLGLYSVHGLYFCVYTATCLPNSGRLYTLVTTF